MQLTDNVILGLVISNIFAVLFLAIKEIMSVFRGATRDNTEAMRSNTKAVTRLEVQMEHLTKAVDKIPRIEKDLNEAHVAIRDLKKQQSKEPQDVHGA